MARSDCTQKLRTTVKRKKQGLGRNCEHEKHKARDEVGEPTSESCEVKHAGKASACAPG